MRKRKRFRAVIWLAVLLFCCLPGLPSHTAWAADLDTSRVITHQLLHYFSLVDGTPIVIPRMSLAASPDVPAFCLTPHTSEPYASSPVGYLPAGPESLFGSQPFIRGVTAIVQHGYPATRVFNGVTYSAEQAYYATSAAIWWLHADLGLPQPITPIGGAVANGNDALFQAARSLYEIGRAQMVQTVAIEVGPAQWRWQDGRLSCAAAVLAHHADAVTVASVPAGITAQWSGDQLRLTTDDLTVLGREVAIELRAASRFANENLIWLAPDHTLYQTVLAVGGESLFAASATLRPQGATGDVHIVKIGRDQQPVTDASAVFHWLDAATGQACGFDCLSAGVYRFGGSDLALVTAQGALDLQGIPAAPGGWLLREAQAPPGHLPTEADIPVVPGTPATRVTVVNPYEMIRVRVVKRDAESGERPQGEASFAGAVFEIWHRDYADYETTPESMRERVTIPDGSDRVETRPLQGGRDPGFCVREVAPPPGYRPDETIWEAIPTAAEPYVATVCVLNQVIRGKVRVEKCAEPAGGAAGAADAWPGMPEVSFRVVSLADGELADTVTTGADGCCESDWLPYGRYQLEEIQGTGNAGYHPAAPVPFVIDTPEEVISLRVDNVAVRVPVTLYKTDALSGQPVEREGFAIEILGKDDVPLQFPVTTARVAGSTTVLSARADGRVVVPGGLTAGTYRAREVAAPAGYVRADTTVSFSVGGEEEAVSLPFPNEPTAVRVEKRNPGGDILPTAEFRLENSDGDVCGFEQTAAGYVLAAAGETVLRSDSGGQLVILGLPEGTYRLVETRAPDGYRLPETEGVTLAIDAAQGVSNPQILTCVNQPVPPPAATTGPSAAPPTPTPVVLPTEPLPHVAGVEVIPDTGEQSPVWRNAGVALCLWVSAGTFWFTRRRRADGSERPRRRNRPLW